MGLVCSSKAGGRRAGSKALEHKQNKSVLASAVRELDRGLGESGSRGPSDRLYRKCLQIQAEEGASTFTGLVRFTEV